MKYSQHEINKNISKLTNNLDVLISQRDEVNKNIANLRRQIKKWKELSED